MSSLKFSLPDRDWQDFVRVHREYQPSILLHGGTRFDIVEGPLFRRYSGEI